MPQKYNQSGGAYVILAWIAQFIIEILKAIWEFLKTLFKICPNDEAEDWKGCFKNLGWKQVNPKKWDWGDLWLYVKWCIKTVIYIIIFCFGGPVVILVGIAYLYSQLFTKLGERTDGIDPSNVNKNNKNNKTNSQG